MKTIDELIRELDSSTGEELYRAIRELGGHGDAARGALEPLLNLSRYHDDKVAVGHALLAVGLIDPRSLDEAAVLADCGDVARSGRKAANHLDPEGARLLVALLLVTPIGSLPADANADPLSSRAVWIREVARKFPCVIPDLVQALTTRTTLGDWLVAVLQWLGKDHPEMIHFLEPLFEHESDSVRDAALVCAASTGRMSAEALPQLIDSAHRESERLQDTSPLSWALSHMADAHPREVVAAIVDTLGADGLYLLHVEGYLQRPAQEAVVEQLLPLLDSPDPELRHAAIVGLKLIGALAIGAIPRLRELLGDDDQVVRDAARDGLTQIGRKLAFGR